MKITALFNHNNLTKILHKRKNIIPITTQVAVC